jgi:hypothetical protein
MYVFILHASLQWNSFKLVWLWQKGVLITSFMDTNDDDNDNDDHDDNDDNDDDN